MTDNTNPAPTGEPEPQTQPANGQTPISSLPPDIQAMIHTLREENKDRRKKQDAADKAAQAAEEKRLVDNAEWQKLAETRQKRLDELEPVAAKYETIESAFNASLENRLKDIPTDIRKALVDPVRKGMSPVEFSDWLDANKSLLSTKSAPPLDGGAGGTRQPNAVNQLTQEQIDMANAGGVPLDVYAKRMAEIAERKRNPRKE